jgi:hypothetical protein
MLLEMVGEFVLQVVAVIWAPFKGLAEWLTKEHDASR